ncbi:hypothetical protein BKN49_05335 [Pseudomonas aeruginosa]|nr:hypothetical protein BKN49_05335 [Pseudomonas aeruginosa]
MAEQPIHAVYAKAGVPLWVTPYDAGQSLRVLNYSPAVIIELSEWMARRMSMSFAAGYLGLKPVSLKLDDVCRQLLKMGYCSQNANQIADVMNEAMPSLHNRGKARRECERPTPILIRLRPEQPQVLAANWLSASTSPRSIAQDLDCPEGCA